MPTKYITRYLSKSRFSLLQNGAERQNNYQHALIANMNVNINRLPYAIQGCRTAVRAGQMIVENLPNQ